MLYFENVTKSFKEDFWKERKVVLNSLSFQVDEGSLCGFLGANGSGKTTSIKSLLGFIAIDSGEIRFDSLMGKNEKETRSNIGYFPEHPYFYSHMTGREFCTYLGRLQGVSKSDLIHNIKYWSNCLNIEFALDNKIKTYSKGMLQRLGFTSALLHNPRLIVLDEPLSGLDPVGRKEFKDVMVELNKKGITVFFSSHIVSDVEEICSSLVVIRNGERFYEGRTDALINKDSHTDLEIVFKSQFPFETIEKEFKDIKLLFVNDNTYRCSIPIGNKSDFLEYSLAQDIDLIEMMKRRPSLEEIIYNTGRN